MSARSYATLSICAALLTIALKFQAYFLTGSVGLLSDAAESIVNLIAAVVAFWMLTIAAKPPDAEHTFGHDKAEYFSSALEGLLILVAAVPRCYSSVEPPFTSPAIGASGGGASVISHSHCD